MSDYMNPTTRNIITTRKRELEALYELHHANIEARWSPVMSVGRKRAKVDIPKTAQRLGQRVAKLGTMINVEVALDGIRGKHIIAHDNQFRIASSFCGFSDTVMQKKLELEIIPTELIITKHAVGRWMERNRSYDIDTALHSIGAAVAKLDAELADLEHFEGLRVFGFMERQVPCPCGGVAIIAVENPEAINYRDMKWAVVTYISNDMIEHWNEEAMSAEFANTVLADEITSVRTEAIRFADFLEI